MTTNVENDKATSQSVSPPHVTNSECENLPVPAMEEIKSTAIVKYSVPKPAQFLKLRCNTDLNLPPSNWLSSSADPYGLQHLLYHKQEFSSFSMSHTFIDCVNEVDLISDAENVKKLLQLAYSKHIFLSMVVHRVGKTLLLDEFDIYKHLFRYQKSEFEWLKKFIFREMAEKYKDEKAKYITNRKRMALNERNRLNKFLYHSIPDAKVANAGLEVKYSLPTPAVGPALPEPSNTIPSSTGSTGSSSSSTSSTSSTFVHDYNRNVVWTFEDIEMLLGTDLPIFGGGTHPCVSLRLRDLSKPINVLTGIDYWLDNLMSNVPELAMCYHLNGVVKKYELIKTEELPRLKDAKFSPKVVKDVAQSILSFLKSNATKEGHTYWLFKDKDDEVVKLYDLTSLCSENDVADGQNPFTVPVAMLLYRVARNMRQTSQITRSGTIKMLLKNCIKLLSKEKHPEIVTSSYYMLSDLYVPSTTNPESPGLDSMDVDQDSEEYSYFDEDGTDKASATNVLVLDKMKPDGTYHYKSPPPISGTLEEKCLRAVQHVVEGLDCLKYFVENSTAEGTTHVREPEEEIPMAKPFEPIPMPYSKLEDDTKNKTENKKANKKSKKKANDKSHENAQVLKRDPAALPPLLKQENISWKDHLQILLYEKAVLVYATLSEYYYGIGKYGISLRNIALVARCQQVMQRLAPNTSGALKENCMLGRAGDCCLMIVQNWDSDLFQSQMTSDTEEDTKMKRHLEEAEQFYKINLGKCNMRCVFIYEIRTHEQMILKSIQCYEEALKGDPEDESIIRRLGNSLNEIGNFYLNKGKKSTNYDLTLDMCKKAETYLYKGLTFFKKVNDNVNMALLYANLGHLQRLLAAVKTPSQRGELSAEEKLHYKKAFANYQKAQQALGDRSVAPTVWDNVKWEMSTALFTMASIMHENPSSQLSKVDAEKEVIETLQKALAQCDLVNEDHPKYPLYQYRAAMIYCRIASLYHNHIWNDVGDSSNRKQIIQLARLNYEKAAKYYFFSLDAMSYFTSQMQRVALLEYLSETSLVPNVKLKYLQSCFEVFLEMNEMIKMIIERKVEVPDSEVEGTENSNNYKSFPSLLDLLKQRLQHVLKTMIKLCLKKPPPQKDCLELSEIYKNYYKLTFRLEEGMPYNELLVNLHNTLNEITINHEEMEKNL